MVSEAMKLTLTSSTRAERLDTFLDYCARMGQGAVDLFDTWVPLKNAGSARRQMEERGVRPVSISTVALMDGSGGTEPAVRAIRQAMKIASEVGAPLVNTAVSAGGRFSTDEQIELYARTVESCLDDADGMGLTLLLENRWDWFGDDSHRTEVTRRAEWIARLIERVDSPRFRSTFDAGNFVTVREEPYPHAYEILKDVIGYVHVKDVTRYHPRRHGVRVSANDDGSSSSSEAAFTNLTDKGLHIWADGKLGGDDPEFIFTPLGLGCVNWEGLLSALRRDGFSGWFQVEPHAYPLFSDNHDRATQQALEYLAASSWFRESQHPHASEPE